MKQFIIGALFISMFLISNCEKSQDLENLTTDAKVIGFVSEKCYCCWGWIIEVDSRTIKADSLPGLSPDVNATFPINARITIGSRIIDCSDYKYDMATLPDYYEIKTLTIIK